MGKWRARIFGLHGRVAIYVLVIILLLIIRGGIDWRGVKERLSPSPPEITSLSLAGFDLAPQLIPRLVARYRQDYPDLAIDFQSGGTAHALEALVNRRADVAFLWRPPLPEEQRAFLAAAGDTALWFPIALGGIAVLRGPACAVDSLDLDALRAFVRGDDSLAGVERLFVPDPNLGLWDAFRDSLGLAGSAPADPARVIFLADEDGVLRAVEADPRALGLGSTLSLPEDLETRGIHEVAIQMPGAARAARPTYEEIGYGEYPLLHRLYIACRSDGGPAGTMFVTHVTSARGQRQIERDGFLPAFRPLREVYLTTDPVGEAS